MENKEAENFRKRVVLAICWAGSDRSQWIADELNQRGYAASCGGVLANHNYVTREDLVGVGKLIFASQADRDRFKKDKKLNQTVKARGIETFVMDISEDEKNKAIFYHKEDQLKQEIAKQLDRLGFSYQKMKY